MATATLSLGEHGVTGRVVLNGTAVANVKVEFKDDVEPRSSVTNAGGHYWFITLAPGTAFTLTFNQDDNAQLTPPGEIAALAYIEGNLPSGVNIITLPDIEISLNPNGSSFELQTPVDGTTYSAAAISGNNPVPFVWTSYSPGGTYRIELGPQGSDQPVWTSAQLSPTSYMWDGTLTDGSHITPGDYWWRVVVSLNANGDLITIYTHPWELTFTNP